MRVISVSISPSSLSKCCNWLATQSFFNCPSRANSVKMRVSITTWLSVMDCRKSGICTTSHNSRNRPGLSASARTASISASAASVKWSSPSAFFIITGCGGGASSECSNPSRVLKFKARLRQYRPRTGAKRCPSTASISSCSNARQPSVVPKVPSVV